MNLDYDFIICGGGISGLLLTVKLSQNPDSSINLFYLSIQFFLSLMTIEPYVSGTKGTQFGIL